MTLYPEVLSEADTLAAVAAGKSIARFGDGELRICLGGNSASQIHSPQLQADLCRILKDPGQCLVGIPNAIAEGPKKHKTWRTYTQAAYTDLYNHETVYGSAFITRPDSAPWIDTPDYWAAIRALWRGQDIVFVKGDDRSLRADQLADAASCEVVTGPTRNAYAVVDGLFEVLRREERRILICLGAAATVLAWRLAQEGVHALDLGHVGMTMRKAGQYAPTWQPVAEPSK